MDLLQKSDIILGNDLHDHVDEVRTTGLCLPIVLQVEGADQERSVIDKLGDRIAAIRAEQDEQAQSEEEKFIHFQKFFSFFLFLSKMEPIYL